MEDKIYKSEILQVEHLDGSKIDKKDISGKVVKVFDYRILPSEKTKGFFGIVRAEHDGKEVTFTISQIMIKQLQSIQKEKFPVDLRLVEKMSNKNDRPYYIFHRPEYKEGE